MSGDCMAYQDGMEVTDSGLMEQVAAATGAYEPHIFTPEDVCAALMKERREARDFGALLSPAAEDFLEQMAALAKIATARHFGNNVRLFTPLYLANFCVNHCVYCGFRCKNKIGRARLRLDEVSRELEAIAATGLDEVLLLTGESRARSDVDYIEEAVGLAARIFSTVGIEIYPLNTDEYARLHACGADFVSVYQETYDPAVYGDVHPMGPKRCYPYRFNAQERAIRGGMRGVGLGALLGLGDFRRDSFATGMHANLLQKKYPGTEISISVPRIRPLPDHGDNRAGGVGERRLLQVMLAFRLFMPFADITISTRERAAFRDHVAGMCATKISAGVSVGVGGHESDKKGGEQFTIADARGVTEIHHMLTSRGLQPVYTDYIRAE